VADVGWCIAPGFIDASHADALRGIAIARRDAGEFRPARVGRAAGATDAPDLRGDSIRWLEPDDPASAARDVLARFDALRAALNRSLYLGLDSLEAHLACYPPGARYGVHVDRFRDDDARAVSVVLYLNDAWTDDDGGSLRLYLERAGESPWTDVRPDGGTLAVFLADRFAHEVLPARRERYSLTGWFRRRA
jgi:SM-20-related protein